MSIVAFLYLVSTIAIFVFVYNNVTEETIGQLIVFGLWVFASVLFSMNVYVMNYLFYTIKANNDSIV